MPICQQDECGNTIHSILDMVRCLRCNQLSHKICLGMPTGAGTFSVPFCKLCRKDREFTSSITITLAKKSERCLAKSTLKGMASRIRSMERVLYEILQLPFTITLPWEGEIDKSMVYSFLLHRSQEGATRAMITSELRLWQETLLELGNAIWPTAWVNLKVNRLFPSRQQAPTVAKEAMAWGTREKIMRALEIQSQTSDCIQKGLALRDRAILLFGFSHLLRCSEIASIQMKHLELDKMRLFIPRSKTDQAGRGTYIPILHTQPDIESVHAELLRLKNFWVELGFGADAYLCIRYNAKQQALQASPITKDAIAQRVRFWLEKWVGMSTHRSKKFASHSLRRGGATYLRQLGVAEHHIKHMGRWTSNCFERYTDMHMGTLRQAICTKQSSAGF